MKKIYMKKIHWEINFLIYNKILMWIISINILRIQIKKKVLNL